MSLTIPVSCASGVFIFLRLLILDFMYLMSLYESDSLNDESENDVYKSRSSGTYYFLILFAF